MHPIDQQLAKFEDATVLCVGDLMLDHFVYGEVSRVSPEASALVIAVGREEQLLGGAGNVARGIAALGARCIFVSVMGEDEAGRLLARTFLDDHPAIETHLLIDRSRPTTRKVRFVSEHYSTHLLRADWEVAAPVGDDIEKALVRACLGALPRADAVVLSDYAKGVLSPPVIRAVIDKARSLGKPVVVDPKGYDFSVYRGATLITPNRKELADATHRAVASDGDVAAAAAHLAGIVESEAVLVTRSEAGMTLHTNKAEAVHVPAYPVKVRDVSGAGDTVAAVMAVLLASGAELEPAARAANAAAAVVVGKRGTSTVTAAELRSRLLPAASLASEEKIVFDWAVLDDRIKEWRGQGLRVGFTNGCFDLLHPGHVRLLTEARAACDRLVVGLNSDASVKRLKGEERPVQVAPARAEVLAALESVDLVVVFEQDTPLDLIRRVRPMVLVKGADYRVEEVVGRELVEADGGEIVLVDLVPGYSTSALVNRSNGNGEVNRRVTTPVRRMTDMAQPPTVGAVPYRARLERAADWLAVAVAASLPWSTSATSLLITLWLVAVLPTLDPAGLRRGLRTPAGALAVALCLLALIGMAWADAPLDERLGGAKPFLRLLAIVPLLIQFERSARGMCVVLAFLISCTLLLLVSWTHVLIPTLAFQSRGGLGVPVKDSLIQSGEFVICAFALVHLTLDAVRDRRRLVAIALAALAFAFLANIVFVATGRSTLLIFAVLVTVLGFQRFGWKGTLGVLLGAAVLSAVALAASSYLRNRIHSAYVEVRDYQTRNLATSSGLRLEMWKKSAGFFADAPVIGHGTGATATLFRRAAVNKNEVSAIVTSNPHNQTVAVAVQLGVAGVALLWAMWFWHLRLFRGSGLAAWLGLGVVVQSIVACLFNSFLFEFAMGWLYVFGVGVLGGMVLRRRVETPP